MVRDALAPPAAFVSYVETRLPVLVREVRRQVGDERFAEQAARDLLTSVAVRWPWYARVPSKSRRDPEQAADRFLRRAFADVIRDYADPQREVRLSLDLSSDSPEQQEPDGKYPVQLRDEQPKRSPLSGRLGPADEAEFIWERSAQTIRRRTLIGGALALMGGLLVVSRPRPQNPDLQEPSSSPTPAVTTVPRGVEVLPTMVEQGRLKSRVSPLPAEIDLAKVSVSLPRGHRALGIFSAADESSVLLLDDGRLYAVPDLRIRPDNPGVMSPDGRFIAFRDTQQKVFDVTTGQSRALTEITTVSSPIWLDPTHLLYSVVGGSQVVSVDGRLLEKLLEVDAADVVVPQGNAEPMTGDPILRATELLPIGRPSTAPARVRRYPATGGQPVDISLQGELTSWVGLWRGIGFGLATGPSPADRGWLARRCQTSGRLPLQLGEPDSAVAAVRAATGAVLRVLIDTTLTGADRIEPVGWLDASTVLVATNSTDVTLILAWGIDSGSLELVTLINKGVRMALADLSLRKPR
jgi:hypothetical protein